MGRDGVASTGTAPAGAASSKDYTVNLWRYYSSFKPLLFLIRSPKKIARFVFQLISIGSARVSTLVAALCSRFCTKIRACASPYSTSRRNAPTL
jgi:hypothetical protein